MSEKKYPPTTTATTTSQCTRVRLQRPAHVRRIQNFILIWLDANINTDTEKCQNIISQLREVVNTIYTFTNVDECVNFINGIQEEKVFIIFSDAYEQTTVPVIHDKPQVSTIFILCENKKRYEQWTSDWPKVKGVYTEIKSIRQALKKSGHDCDQNTISMSFVPSSGGKTSENLDQLDQSFMYTQILKEILLTIDFEPVHINGFIRYFREQFIGNNLELKNVDKIEREYRLHTPIWWYTYQSFLYSTLNRSLRTMDVELIVSMGFFIHDLHQHLAELHSTQFAGHDHTTSFSVYRGQGLSQKDFDQMLKTKGGLLSFNNFLSTSTNRQVSLSFAQQTMETSDMVGILFVMNIDPSVPSTPFANVRDVSYFEGEEEILFSMHSIFRIRQLEQMNENNRLWQVDLTLTSDNDPQLRSLTERIREEIFPHLTGWYRLGNLLIKTGQFNKAQQIFEIMLDQTTNDRDKANIYHMLGLVKDNQEENAEALTFYEKSNEILQKILPPTHSDVATSYNNIGSMYWKMNENSKALSSYEKALEIRQKTLPENDPLLATSYNNIGGVYDNMGEYLKALFYYEKALEIKQKVLPAGHPSLATSYSNIGWAYKYINDYSKALSFFERALDIRKRSLPPNHPDLESVRKSIEIVKKKL
ncbi:unnamed protein product [Adineta steineri]|uniref:NAD(P)(+)--arginine ADP-ribosyltransferase n=1 Tax=Adineta steineri TaxID=433720 RepID=A0A815RUH3_9BILA|nr:unnamed protein product [Adineta steineri]CAF3997866.1 unnamed protein product [Adineta steineri]